MARIRVLRVQPPRAVPVPMAALRAPSLAMVAPLAASQGAAALRVVVRLARTEPAWLARPPRALPMPARRAMREPPEAARVKPSC